jgi:hypothetical protein
VADARKAAQGDDVTVIRGAVQRLNKVSQQAAETLYRSTSAPEGGATREDGPSAKPEGDVVDAEYTVKE